MGPIILLAHLTLAIWLLRRDARQRGDISPALWIPTLWVAILISRPLSFWVGFGSGTNALEGSPLDRLFYFFLILASFIVLHVRSIDWGRVFRDNWAIFLFYGFCLLSVTWADNPFSSFKRWFKDLGLVFVALVILTEKNKEQAIRAVYIRCAIVLLPLSVIFIRWFPDLGRFYSSHGGGPQIVGVTMQKNQLGILALVSILMLSWDCLHHRDRETGKNKTDRTAWIIRVLLLFVGLYLMVVSQSKTSMLCMMVGVGILSVSYLPRNVVKIPKFGKHLILGTGIFYVFNKFFDLSGYILRLLGRDTSLTGRTEIWHEIFSLNTNPLIGTGFSSFWSDQAFVSQLPVWARSSAHNGYIEVYLDGGLIAIGLMVIMLFSVFLGIQRGLHQYDRYAVIRLSCFALFLVGNYSESHSNRFSSLWFLFLLTALQPASVGTLSQELRVQTFMPVYIPKRQASRPVPSVSVTRSVGSGPK